MDILLLIIGLAIGTALGYFIASSRLKSTITTGFTDTINQLQLEKITLETRIAEILNQGTETLRTLDAERLKNNELTKDNSRLAADLQNISNRLSEQKNEVEQLQKKFSEQFEGIANRLFIENSQRIQDQHREKLDTVLNPLKEKIEKFEKKVEETHRESIRENQSLKEQITTLQKLNMSIGEDAKNLTSALKGQTKTQGNWGEFILEKVLERSGLVRGREYEIQVSLTTEDGKRYQPDVIINLPEGKHIVIDAKVSLKAYEEYYNTEDETRRQQLLDEHLRSMRNHIKELSSKNYQNIYSLKSLDFVLLFVPVEPAFTTAVERDINLFNDAFEKNIIIVSTSTLLATLRTIANIWRQEYTNKNAIEIARQTGDLYDKFVSFTDDLIKIGKTIDSSKELYTEAMKKLATGNGNVVKRVEKIRELGIKTTKNLPQGLIDRASSEE